MTEVSSSVLARLVRSVAILALPFDSQIDWLRHLGLGEPEYADELALELADGVLLLAQFVQLQWLNSQTVQMLKALDAKLAARSGIDHEAFWRIEALRDSHDWQAIRVLANEALGSI